MCIEPMRRRTCKRPALKRSWEPGDAFGSKAQFNTLFTDIDIDTPISRPSRWCLPWVVTPSTLVAPLAWPAPYPTCAVVSWSTYLRKRCRWGIAIDVLSHTSHHSSHTAHHSAMYRDGLGLDEVALVVGVTVKNSRPRGSNDTRHCEVP